ncbi:MAG: low temperature requirement protein A [Gammaproteobacteria bacterium]|jgi:low temperature requirement protein LtrA|nr:low temperature requirement protein A [Gammaproteobacteria bacterium]MBU2178825.1 low temperature requirement protein A [Gammaproteobacteria bacterium]MBU2279932.1 low temperature requirement protein A [Gammaproteobacteria bacterium]MBU2425908.1 low temperature requirement protein A [Gammaproteobacteria bacterium]
MPLHYLSDFLRSGVRAMPPRATDETHRAATPLELLFDLVAVIAIAAAAAELHHAVAHAHFFEGISKFVLAFFAIWWAWMNFSWFASAYDNDDVLFRLLTMLVMAGSLTMAAGISPFFRDGQLNLIVIGFVIMRIGMVLFWLRAARHHPELKRTTLTYAAGIFLVQLYWVGLMLQQPMPAFWLLLLFGLGAVLELLVPALAERQGTTPWHRHHMIERYGLLNIIVLGETLLASSMAISHLTAQHTLTFSLLQLPLLAMVVLFCLWWLYFSREEQLQQSTLKMALTWGYGHLLIYAAGAAVGAGIAVNIDSVLGSATISPSAAVAAVTLPISVYLLGLWLVRDQFVFQGAGKYMLPFFAILIPIAGQQGGLWVAAVLLILCVMLRSSHACCSSKSSASSTHTNH